MQLPFCERGEAALETNDALDSPSTSDPQHYAALELPANEKATIQPSASSSSATSTPETPVPHSYPHWHDIVGGAASGLGSRALTAPLDLLKIRRQLQPDTNSSLNKNSGIAPFINGEWKIFHHLHSIAEKEGGVRSLFRGNVAASYHWMWYYVVQFWVYGHTSEYLHKRYDAVDNGSNSSNSKTSTIISFSAGAISGLCGTIITYPFDLCRTIFAVRGMVVAASNVTWSKYTTTLASESQSQYTQGLPPKTLSEFSQQLYHQKGINGFFAGSTPALLQIVPYMGLNFALHDVFVSWSESSSPSGSSGSVVSGVAGMGAGVISKFLVYPLDTVKKRLQAQAFWGSISGSVRRSTNYNSAFPKLNSTRRKKIVGAVNNGIQNTQNTQIAYKGMVDCFQQVARREGLAAFYKGPIPSLLKSLVSTGASFWLFTLTRNVLRSVHDNME